MAKAFEDVSTSDSLSQQSWQAFSDVLGERLDAVDELFREVRRLNYHVGSTTQLMGMDAGLSSAIQILRGVPLKQVRDRLCLEATAESEIDFQIRQGKRLS